MMFPLLFNRGSLMSDPTGRSQKAFHNGRKKKKKIKVQIKRAFPVPTELGLIPPQPTH